MQYLRGKIKTIPALFAILTVLAYGILIPFLGFYWDDWPFAWIAKFLGPAEFTPAFMPFRPFLGPIFHLTTALVPPYPVYWQIFALVIHFTIGCAAWWMFTQIWNDKPRIAFTTALFMLIFPGYSQHWVALTHINQELIAYIFYLFSFGFTFKALRSERPAIYSTIALLLQICGIFPTEYFFTLEATRFFFLFFHFEGNFIHKIRKTFKTWTPYLIVWMLNALWLFYYYNFGPYNSYEVTSANQLTLSIFLLEMLDAFWKVGIQVWIQIFGWIGASPTAPASILTIGLILFSLAFLHAYKERFNGESESRAFALSLIVLGLAGIATGRIPSLAAGLPLRLQTTEDRYIISMMIGACLFMVGLLELITSAFRQNATLSSISTQATRRTITILLVALSIGQQFFTANTFRRDWEDQREILWELAWRIPALEPNTILFAYQLHTDYEADFSFVAPVNWMYAPDFQRGQDLPYALIFTEKRLGGGTLPSLDPNTPVKFAYRTVNFNGNTSRSIMLYKETGCLRVLDPARGDVEIYIKEPDKLTAAIPLSDLSLIIPDPQTPVDLSFLSKEPKHEWCYYFAKAELAHQQRKYEETISLLDHARELSYAPVDLNEWLIYIDAQIALGDVDSAYSFSQDLIAQEALVRRGVCVVWKQNQAQVKERSAEILSALDCPQ